MKVSRLVQTLSALAFSAAAFSSHASLIYMTHPDVTGAGLGAVNTILTIQGQSNGANATTSETGSVFYQAGGDVLAGNDVKSGNSQTKTQSLGDIGITDASQIRIVFNANEINNDGINLTNLVLTIYDTQGNVKFNSGAFSEVDFASTNPGIGQSGFVFKLDDEQTALANLNAINSSYRIGLLATATNFNDGPETFYVMQGPGTNPGGGGTGTGNVPEPATVALLGLGLAGVTLSRRKRK